jgi:hypothetical protein
MDAVFPVSKEAFSRMTAQLFGTSLFPFIPTLPDLFNLATADTSFPQPLRAVIILEDLSNLLCVGLLTIPIFSRIPIPIMRTSCQVFLSLNVPTGPLASTSPQSYDIL